MSDPFIGQIMPVAFNYAPEGWAFCDGQVLSIAQNQALFALISATFGGDGRNTFGLPDLRGRVAVHPGTGPGLAQRLWGQKGGTETNTLNLNNLPPHTHTASLANLKATNPATTVAATDSTPGASLYPAVLSGADARGGAVTVKGYAANANTSLAPGAVTGDIAIGNTGAGTGVGNMQPWLGIYFCIALTGIWPQRP
jgi:microcystin-dependent protein